MVKKLIKFQMHTLEKLQL